MPAAKRLTEPGIDKLRPKAERIEYPDALVSGLRLVLQPSGKKSWAVRTRVHGRTAKFTLGPYPTLSLIEAREAARKLLLTASAGDDPRALKAAKRAAAADTVEALVADWLKRDQAGNRSAAEVARLFDREVLPKWRHRPVSTIGRRDCMDLIDGMADRGATTYARRLHAHLHRMFRWSVGRGVIAANPMSDLPKPGNEVARDRVLDDAELAAVWQAADAIGWPFGPAVRLLLLTGARRDEIGELTWDEVDLGAATIRLAGERTKTGEARTIPLSAAAVAILEGVPRIKAAKGAPDFVFSTTGRTAASGWSRAKARLDGLLGDMPPWRVHDLRRSLATGLQRHGERLEVIEAVLGHTSGSRSGVVGVYQRHAFEPEKRRALDTWSRHVMALVEGRPPADVVRLHPRRDATI